jgi:hypothetical protein
MQRKRTFKPTPPVVVGEHLAACRRNGMEFDAAWSGALVTVKRVSLNGVKKEPRHEWLDALDATRAEWQAAYEGVETHFSVIAAGRATFAAGVADWLTDPWTVAAA